MSTASTRPPEGRYGRSSDARADRTLKVAGGVLGALLLALIGYFAYHYVGQNKISGELITFQVADDSVQVHLEVRKDSRHERLLHGPLAGRERRRGGPRRLPLLRHRHADRQGGHAPYDVTGHHGGTARLSRGLIVNRNRQALTCVDAILRAYVLPLGPLNC